MNLMLPEMIIILTGFVVLLSDLFLKEDNKQSLGVMAFLGVLLALVVNLTLLNQQGELFGGRFVLDSVSGWFKLSFLLSALIVVALSYDMLNGKSRSVKKNLGSPGEYYMILLFTLTGMMYLISSRDLITLYVSLELTTVPLFVLAAWKREDAKSGEAGLKYIILGALSSGFILYGMGILYGLSGSTDLKVIADAMQPGPAFYLSVMLITAGVGFKLAMVPFHMWAADVYQGAPTPITAYLSVGSKGAGLAFLFQFFFRMMGEQVAEWGLVIALLAAATMTLGNVVAIVQQNIKRFMAFSSISQAGYLLMGFLGPYPEGVSAMLFYMLVYVVTNLTVFAIIIFYSNETGKENIDDYKGLSITNPVLALAMMVGLFSLAGIPPLSGFVGKFFLFSVASKAGFHWLVGIAALNSTISLYYYLRIVRQMYIEPKAEGASKLSISPILKYTVAIPVVAVVLMGIIPYFYELIHQNTIQWLVPLM